MVRETPMRTLSVLLDLQGHCILFCPGGLKCAVAGLGASGGMGNNTMGLTEVEARPGRVQGLFEEH